MKTKPKQNNVCHPQTVDIPEPLTIHPSVSPLAAELLMKTADRLIAHPELYCQMGVEHKCGSPCCIIGHMKDFAGSHDIGLSGDQFQSIYHAADWPRKLMKRIEPNYVKNSGSRYFPASHGIARIEWFLRTGE